MRIRTLLACFVILVLGLFVVFSVYLIRVSDLLDRSARDLAMAGDSIRVAEELKSALLTHNRNAFLYSLLREPGRMESRRAQRAQILQMLDTVKVLSAGAHEKAVLDDLTVSIQAYLDQRQALTAANLSPTEEYSRISVQVDRAIAVTDRLIALNRLQMQQLISEIQVRNAAAVRAAVFLLALGGVVLLVLIVGVVSFVVRPLSRLTRVVEYYGHGHSEARAEPKGLDEIREIADNFNGMAERLEGRRQEQARLLAAVAHDLRNPLQSIEMASDILVRKSAAEDRELAEVVRRQVGDMEQLLRDLLDSSRIEAGQLELELTSIDVPGLIRDCVELHRSGAQLHHFVLQLPEEPVFCQCDRSRLSQVFNNLLSNALKYSPNGGTVEVRVTARDGQVELSVSDQGIGIPVEDLENIFIPFHRTAVTRGTIPGVGLGLSASRRIIEAHGGWLQVESKVGKGSTFLVRLPCAPPPSIDPPQETASESPAEASAMEAHSVIKRA